MNLTQCPRAWFDRFSKVVLHIGFRRCQADHIVLFFLSNNKTRKFVILVAYVDDKIITGNDEDEIAKA